LYYKLKREVYKMTYRGQEIYHDEETGVFYTFVGGWVYNALSIKDAKEYIDIYLERGK
jgi:hypothetical protein